MMVDDPIEKSSTDAVHQSAETIDAIPGDAEPRSVGANHIEHSRQYESGESDLRVLAMRSTPTWIHTHDSKLHSYDTRQFDIDDYASNDNGNQCDDENISMMVMTASNNMPMDDENNVDGDGSVDGPNASDVFYYTEFNEYNQADIMRFLVSDVGLSFCCDCRLVCAVDSCGVHHREPVVLCVHFIVVDPSCASSLSLSLSHHS